MSRPKGQKLSIEHRRKIGLSNLGKKRSKEYIEKFRNRFKGRKQTLEQIEKRVSQFRGEKSHFWKGGITVGNKKIRLSFEYKIWRRSVFERDRWKCIWCGYRSKGKKYRDINADHIKPFAYFPELRFAIDNGRTLCVPCHRKTDTYGVREKVITKL